MENQIDKSVSKLCHEPLKIELILLDYKFREFDQISHIDCIVLPGGAHIAS